MRHWSPVSQAPLSNRMDAKKTEGELMPHYRDVGEERKSPWEIK